LQRPITVIHSQIQQELLPQRMAENIADTPPPVDAEAVQQIKEAIRNNEYPVDYEKIADKLLESAQQLTE
jgi:flagellar biosynthesis anti-sigma factor FlgM